MLKALLLRAWRGARASDPVPAPGPAGDAAATAAEAVLKVNTLIDAGELAEATRSIEPLVAACPNDPDLQFLLGRLALKQGDRRAAVEYFENTVALRPDHAAAYVELARLYGSSDEVDRAQACYETALRLVPDSAELHHNLGLLHFDQGSFLAAEQCFAKALQLNPQLAQAMNNLGRVHSERRQYDAALACFRAALAMNPRDLHASVNLGQALIALGEHDDALAQLETCRGAAPGHIEIICGLGEANFALGRMAAARQCYREALALDAARADAHFALANIALLEGDWAAGWQGYEWRMQLPRRAQNYAAREPRWRGESLHGKTLAIDAEQGFGDILMFARFLPRVSESGAAVVFRSPPALVRLLRGFPGLDRVVDAQSAEAVAADVSLPLLSLGHVLGVAPADVGGPAAYLRAPPDLASTWRAKLAGDAQLRVGLAWGGNPLRRHERSRVPQMADFRALGAIPGATFYNLQLGFSAEEIAEFPLPLIDFASDIEDFADTAALVENLDLVIAVDTSVAHLGSAMGKPTWVLHPGTPDWRWEIAGRESPWYPSARLFRRRDGSWAQPLADVATSLRRILHTRQQA